jgi:hypothetical protein
MVVFGTTLCEILTVQTFGFAVDADIYVPAVNPVPAIYCPTYNCPVIGDVMVRTVPLLLSLFPSLIFPTKELDREPVVMTIGTPEDPTV